MYGTLLSLPSGCPHQAVTCYCDSVTCDSIVLIRQPTQSHTTQAVAHDLPSTDHGHGGWQEHGEGDEDGPVGMDEANEYAGVAAAGNNTTTTQRRKATCRAPCHPPPPQHMPTDLSLMPHPSSCWFAPPPCSSTGGLTPTQMTPYQQNFAASPGIAMASPWTVSSSRNPLTRLHPYSTALLLPNHMGARSILTPPLLSACPLL